MQLASTGTIDTFAGLVRGSAAATGPGSFRHPRVDPIVDAQIRFRVEGTGPLSQRTLVPATTATREQIGAGADVEEAARALLRVVESTAGGPEASSSVTVNGVSLARDHEGYVANTYRARVDDGAAVRSTAASLLRPSTRKLADAMYDDTSKQVATSLANVTYGWMNLGPATSRALLARRGDLAMSDVADAVRIIRHESGHLVDGSPAGLSPRANNVLAEVVAEHGSNQLDQLRQARHDLGFDDRVHDRALRATTFRYRPYVEHEHRVSRIAGALGLAPQETAALADRGSKALADALVQRLVAQGMDDEAARAALDEALVTGVTG